jgi:hypothetical protein
VEKEVEMAVVTHVWADVPIVSMNEMPQPLFVAHVSKAAPGKI